MRRYTLNAPEPAPDRLDLANKLNEQQRDVVTAAGGPMLVIAGAGSGKTHTLTYRVAWLIERGVDPGRILLLTFTNKAARAMCERVEGLLGPDRLPSWSGTFHSIANRALRRDGHLLGYPRDFTIIDSEDAQTLMRTSATELFPEPDRHLPKPRVLARLASLVANTLRPLDAVLREFYPYLLPQQEPIASILARYRQRKFDMALMDFDDLLSNWHTLLSEHEEIGRKWSARFEHVLVDEYQDTNLLQGAVVDLLSQTHGNIMVVGDDCQSIYAFRGANFANILEFPERHERCRQFRLEQNYRSTPEILELANRSILYNHRQFHKKLRAERATGPRPALVSLKDVYQQAQFVCQRIQELAQDGVPLSRVAVLYRSHYHSMELQVELTKRGLPYLVRSGMRFFEQAHVKDVLAYLRFVYNPRDELSFLRLTQQWQGIGAKRALGLWHSVQRAEDTLAAMRDPELGASLPSRARPAWHRITRIFEELEREGRVGTPGDMIESILDGGYDDVLLRSFENAENRLADLEQLAGYAAQYEDLDTFLAEISLLTTLTSKDLEGDDAPEEQITLTSIHQAKGLEWDACFVLWLAEGHFPHANASKSLAQFEEERRLFYVATTRARDDLYLCHPFSHYSRTAGLTFLRPSPFLGELEVPGMEDEEPWERWMIDG